MFPPKFYGSSAHTVPGIILACIYVPDIFVAYTRLDLARSSVKPWSTKETLQKKNHQNIHATHLLPPSPLAGRPPPGDETSVRGQTQQSMRNLGLPTCFSGRYDPQPRKRVARYVRYVHESTPARNQASTPAEHTKIHTRGITQPLLYTRLASPCHHYRLYSSSSSSSL